MGIQDGQKCGIVTFDIEKAFDRAPHKKILERLEKYRCPSLIGKWLCSLLTNRIFHVRVDGEISDIKRINAGTPQGSPLSPILFSLLINEIGKVLDKHDLHYALFADDLVIWKIGTRIDYIEKKLQRATTAILNFFEKICLNINEKKCLYSVFTKKRITPTLNIRVKETPIKYTSNPVILGITFDKKLTFTDHFKLISKKISSKINLLRLLCHKSCRINKKALRTIYNSLILSKIQYSMIPYMHTNSKTKTDLQVIQNKCLRCILNLPTRSNTDSIHNALKMDKLDARISNLCTKYIKNATITNDSIRKILENSFSVINNYNNTVLSQINLKF